jgi:4a-hydroxytetrahydrobiopterin dehydratase
MKQKPDDRSVARMVLLNLLVLPGLGSLRAGLLYQGIGQIALAIIGSIIMLVWFVRELSQYYGLMFGDEKPESIGWIGLAGGVLIVLSWLWALLTSLFYHHANALQSSRPPIKTTIEKSPSVSPEILSAIGTIPNWQREGQVISRTFQFEDFPAAMKFVNAVAQIAEQFQHHPDIDIRWNRVTLALTTHDAGGLTEKDFALARRCDALVLA